MKGFMDNWLVKNSPSSSTLPSSNQESNNLPESPSLDNVITTPTPTSIPGSSSSARTPVDLSMLPSDPAERKPICQYHPNDRDEVKRAYLQKGPYQPRAHDFPKSDIGGLMRRFNPLWFDQDEYASWLEYSIKEDAAFCLRCCLFKNEPLAHGGDTRWSSHYKSLVNVGILYGAIIDCLDSIAIDGLKSDPPLVTSNNPNSGKRKRKNQTPESNLRFELETCLKHKDFNRAFSLFESATAQNLNLSYHHYSAILYLCSAPETLASEHKTLALEHGFRIFDRMLGAKIPPTEATITGMARLAAARSDPDYAFELVKTMKGYGIVPRLRTYDPALYWYCENSMADKAYAVEEHMKENGVKLEEAEIVALFRVSASAGREDKVYEYLHKLRATVRSVSVGAATASERWFKSEKAEKVGCGEYDLKRLREKREENGGGWHGLGWVGSGRWHVKSVFVDQHGGCYGCGERLVCVDIDVGETEKFAQSIAGLAMEREAKSNFRTFMDWIERHSDYEAIVDAANIALYQQNFEKGGFNIQQLEAVVRELYNRKKRWPLVVVHNKRLRGLQQNPSHRKFLDELRAQNALYATPTGSNDDWYWLYAAVKLKCLLVTNDEMRDHIFELLGSSFFLQWKERHQVHYTLVRGLAELQLPPAYSIIIQESEKGSWHIPISNEGCNESKRPWLCITRPAPSVSTSSPATLTDQNPRLSSNSPDPHSSINGSLVGDKRKKM